MITKKINISCAWGGHLACILLKKHVPSAISQPTKKIIGIHGWLDNINSLFPIARRLVDQQPNYEVCLYDRAGHGFSSHFPRGTDYSFASNLLDLRTIIQNLGWNKEKYSIIGHSYGGTLALIYAAAYPKEIASLAVLEPFAGSDYSSEKTWKSIATRIENNLQYFNQPPKTYKGHLTHEKAVELIKSSRNGIDDQSANLLVERSVRQDADQKLYFTRDGGLNNLQITPISHEIVTKAIERIPAPILFLGTTEPQWPTSNNLIPLLQSHNPNFEVFLVDGPHHFHMTHVDTVSDRIEQYFQKHLKE